jgi:hypothetical protein
MASLHSHIQVLIRISFLGGVAGEGYHYLRSVMWWSGMILSKLLGMIGTKML